jgi:hypothetical protein
LPAKICKYMPIYAGKQEEENTKKPKKYGVFRE